MTEKPAPDVVDDETYEIGKRDGYESAVQELDLATGGDGEFRGSTLPGGTVDVPTMKQRIIDRFSALQARPDAALVGELTRLFDLLDDIDTLDDVCKGDDAAFRKRAYEIQRKRFDGGITTDGYTLDISALRTHDDTLEDAARLNWLQHEMNDIRWTNDSDDGVICRIVSHWQSEPQERVEGENWNENLRAAIDEARNLKGKDRT